ncbi:hypothetical protein NLX67_04660 [Domibacillus sp. A3M-37]|uniref:hypothetical protein n=1 Tax=Domibacillus sp. A3M-37 TaxID=2962037 RepID=UPI0020B68372|nr:hypothetical protein [Domibacillus sp. A3M-37]MCP3761678.1 hypothetical protein [Domibacillus sp. A3M-37]
MFFLKGHAISLIILTLAGFPSAALEEDKIGLQTSYMDAGYSSLSEAFYKSSHPFNRGIGLSVQDSPVLFIHNSGRLNYMNGEINGEFAMDYINQNQLENHLIIRVKPIGQQVKFKEDEIDHSIQLKHGTEAVYLFGNRFNTLAFEKDGWQYMITTSKHTSGAINLDLLTAIANSIIETAK